MILNTYLRWFIIGGIFAMPFISLVVLNDFFFPFITGKNFIFRILVELMFGAWIILAIRDVKYRPRLSYTLVALLIFTFVIGIADVLGVNFQKSFWSNYERMEGYVTILHLLALFVTVSAVMTSDKIWKRFFITSLGLSALIALKESPELVTRLTDENVRSIRLDATFGNPIYLAVYNLFHVFIGLFVLHRYVKDSWARMGVSIVIGLNVILLLFTSTRGTTLGLIGGILLTTLIIAFFEKESKSIRNVAIGTIVAVMVMIGGFLAIKDAEFIKDTPVLNRFAKISFDDKTTKARFMIWGMALEGVKERPLLGWGQGNFTWIFSKHYNPDMYSQEPWFDRAHNVFFDWLTAGGILGLAAYLLIFFAGIFHIWYPRENSLKLIGKAILTGLLAGYFFHNIFVFDNLISYIFFILVSAAIVMVGSKTTVNLGITTRDEEDRSDYTKKSVSKKKDEAPSEVEYAIPIIIGLFTLVGVWMINVDGIRTNLYLLSGLSGVDSSGATPVGLSPKERVDMFDKALQVRSFGTGEVRERFLFFAMEQERNTQLAADVREKMRSLSVEEMKLQIAEVPGDSKYPLFLSSYFMSIGQFDQALEYGELALSLSPKKQEIMYQLGSIYLNQGNFQEAFNTFKGAYEVATENRQAAEFYALSAVYLRDKETTQMILDEHYDGEIIANQNFAAAYAASGQIDKANEVWKILSENSPSNPDFAVQLSATYVELGEKDKAIEVLQELKKRLPDLTEQVDSFIAQIESEGS